MMPVRFDSQKIKRAARTSALVLMIDSRSMRGPKLEAAKESARVTAEVLSPNDYISVVAFDSAGAGIRCARSARRTGCGSRRRSRA